MTKNTEKIKLIFIRKSGSVCLAVMQGEEQSQNSRERSKLN